MYSPYIFLISLPVSSVMSYTAGEVGIFKDETMATKRNKRANPIFVRDTEGIDGKRLAQYLLSLRKVGEADQTPVSTKSDADSWAKTHKPFPQSHLDFYPLGLVEEQLRGRYDDQFDPNRL